MEKGTRGISWGPLLTPGPRAVPEFPNGQSAPALSARTHRRQSAPNDIREENCGMELGEQQRNIISLQS
ncbi:unnamed protein product, partial [Staurois parvus]